MGFRWANLLQGLRWDEPTVQLMDLRWDPTTAWHLAKHLVPRLVYHLALRWDQNWGMH